LYFFFESRLDFCLSRLGMCAAITCHGGKIPAKTPVQIMLTAACRAKKCALDKEMWRASIIELPWLANVSSKTASTRCFNHSPGLLYYMFIPTRPRINKSYYTYTHSKQRANKKSEAPQKIRLITRRYHVIRLGALNESLNSKRCVSRAK